MDFTSAVFIFILILAVLGFRFIWKKTRRRAKWKLPKNEFPQLWRTVLHEKVNFYHILSDEEKKVFEYEVQEFLLNVEILGIRTEIDHVDKLLVAASAVIPVFSFPEWKYYELFEVFIYPDAFNRNFETEGEGRNINGMVGEGFMKGKMILSQKALHRGFDNTTDKRNVAVHEFIHLIDMTDGDTDGVPSVLLEQPYVIPWVHLMHEKISKIKADESDIRYYGATNKIEFFAVAGEYFFERPHLMRQNHPALYRVMENIFKHSLHERQKLHTVERPITSRNALCPCNSGEKYKRCCGKAA